MIQVPTTLVLNFDDAMRGPKGDKGDPGINGVTQNPIQCGMAQYTPYIGSVGPYSGQQYSTQWGTYGYFRDPIKGGGWCWGQAYLQFSQLGTFTGQLTLNLPYKVANMPGMMGGVCTYFSNPTPQASWPTVPAPSWGWPLMRFSGNVSYAFLDTRPLPGYNPPPMTVEFINFHSQFSFNFHYAID